MPRQLHQAISTERLSDASTVSLDAHSMAPNVPAHNHTGHPQSRAAVLLNAHELWQRAHDTRNEMNFRTLTDLSVTQWKWKASNNRFTLFQRQVETLAPAVGVGSTAYEVLSAGEIRCSVAELVHLLRPESERDHNAVMQALYQKDFIYGAHVLNVPAVNDAATRKQQQQQQQSSGSVSSASDAGSSTATDDNLATEQLSVKTSTFVRSSLFAKNEQWCYLEHFKPLRASEPASGFSVTISSLHESELRTGKADSDRVNDLHDIVAGYLVEKVPEDNMLRVLFYAQYKDAGVERTSRSYSSNGKASTNAMKARLTFLAKGASRLPDVVRRRRLGAQTFADRKAFAASNTRCTCCTKSLHMFSKKKRCYLCGYFVCDKHWSIQRVETRQSQLSTVRVCARCLETVELCDYAHVAPHQLGVPIIHPDPVSTTSPSATIATFLRDALRNAGSESKKQSVQSVIKHLVGQEEAKAHAGSSSFSLETQLTDASGERDYHAALDAYLAVDDVLPLDQCVLANAEQRAYSINIPENPQSGDAPAFPIAPNEATRLETIEREHLHEIGNAEEFNIIASLAARELDCHASLITVITDNEQLVLGANLTDLQTLAMPRGHAFCSHTILDDKPLVLPHPEADVRFANFIPVKHLGAKFYCGFPIVGRDNTVVGSVCCLDMKSHELTQSQYAAMTKLAATASKVMQLKGQEIESRARAATGTYVKF